MKKQSKITMLLRMVKLVKPLTGFMLLAILMGTLGFLCAQFIPILGGYAVLHGLNISIPLSINFLWFALIGIALATYMYKGEETPVADMLAAKLPRLHRAAYKRFYMDEVWLFVTHKIIFRLFSRPIAWFDRRVVDGTFNFMAWGANEAGESLRPWQSGDVRQYAVWFLTGSVALALILLAM